MKVKLIISFLAISFALNAQNSVKEVAFTHGERLEYVVSYRAKFVPNSEVADVVFNTSSSRMNSRDVLHINANAKVRPFFKWFFDLNDTYNSWLDAQTLRPVKFTTDLREGSYRFSSSLTYNWNTMTAESRYRNLKRPDVKTKTLLLSTDSYDAIALFFNLRSTSPDIFIPGHPQILELVLEDTVRRVQYKFLGREEREIKNFGRFHTLKFSCQLTTSSGESFEDGSEFFLWISDDRNRIPLYIESPIKVGSIRARITKFENLKFPLESKIN